MKKTSLSAASALLSVLLLSSPALAATGEKATEAPASVQQEAGRPMRSGAPKPLSEDKMKLVKATAEKLRAQNKDLLAQERALRQEMHDLLVAATFDREAYLAKHAEGQKLRAKMAEARAVAVADLAPQLTAEERAGLPRLLMHGPAHGKKGGMMKNKKGKDMGKKPALDMTEPNDE